MWPLALLATLQSADTDSAAALRKSSVPIATVEVGHGFADLEPLRKAIGGATIVGLGEATHGSREIFQAKHRMLEFLVERMGFRVFALESSLPDTVAIDDYVQTGKGDLAAAVKEQGFWTWSTEEMRDLVAWMRAYNADPKHREKLHVVGVDVQNYHMVWDRFTKWAKAAGVNDPAVDDFQWYYEHRDEGEDIVAKAEEIARAVLPEVRRKHGEARARLVAHMPTVLRQASMLSRQILAQETVTYEKRDVPGQLPEVGRKAGEALKAMPDLKPDARWGLDLLSRLSQIMPQGPAGLAKEGVTPRRLRAAIRAMAAREDAQSFTDALEFLAAFLELSAIKSPLPRDEFMADNLQWLGREYVPGAKVVFWAFNSHVGRTVMKGQPITTGAHLAARMGNRYYPLGSVFGQGSFRSYGKEGRLEVFEVPPAKVGSMDALLAAVGKLRFFLNLDGLPAPAKKWLDAPRPWRNIGSNYDPAQPDRFYEPLNPVEQFRGLVFLDRVTAAKAL